MHAKRIAAWLAALLTAAGLAGALLLDVLASPHGPAPWVTAAWVVATLTSSGVGLALATSRSENPIGWLLLANALVLVAMGVTESYADYALLAHPGALPGGAWAVLFSDRGWPLLFFFVTAIAWVFPDGRLPSRRWRPFALAGAASCAVLMAVSFLSSSRFGGATSRMFEPVAALSGPVFGIIYTISALGGLATLVAGALAVRDEVPALVGERAPADEMARVCGGIDPGGRRGMPDRGRRHRGRGRRHGRCSRCGAVRIPAAIGIAVTRYRLYEIDRLINRTLVYASLSAGLAAVFAVVSLSLGVVIGSGSTLSTAAATLTAALLFGPLRRAHAVAGRQALRPRPLRRAAQVERYLEDLRAGRAAPEATGQMLAQALGDPGLELLFWLPGRGLRGCIGSCGGGDRGGRPCPHACPAGDVPARDRRARQDAR